jgi:hypothetical protein
VLLEDTGAFRDLTKAKEGTLGQILNGSSHDTTANRDAK